MDKIALEQEFAARLQDALRQTHALNYSPTRIESMLEELGAVDLARAFVNSGVLQHGLTTMAKLGRKHLTVEAIMLEPKFASLFSADELQHAAHRLAQI